MHASSKRTRVCRWVFRPAGESPGVVEVEERRPRSKKLDRYDFALIPIDASMGLMAAAWTKHATGETHHCREVERGRWECDCRGFVAHGHCKHASATPKLLAGL